jgi:hypothetical protein
MKDTTENKASVPDRAWLVEEDPEVYYLLRGMEGDREALKWLKHKGEGLYLFAKALDGDRPALDALSSRKPSELADLCDTIAHCDVEQWLEEHYPDLHRLFAFVRGDETTLRGLKHRKVTCKRLAEVVRKKYRNYHDADADGEPEASANGAPAIPEGAAADVGCLIGEMHLQNEEFHKAVEAFSRAVETNPTADAYEGRARAYRGLADLDERAAQLLRGRAQS